MTGTDDRERAWRALLTAMRAFPPLMSGGSWTERETLAIARSPACPVPILNAIWVIGDPPAKDVIAAIESLEADRLPAPILVREGRSPSIEAAAPGLGLILEERIPLMVTTPSELAMGSVEGLELLVVSDERGLDEARRVLETGFGAPDGLLRPMYVPPLTEDPGFTTAVARTPEGPVCTAQTMRRGEEVGIYSVATPEEHRGHGYGGALSAWVTERAFEDGATFAYLQSSAMGVSVYRRIGFREVDMFAVYTRPAPRSASCWCRSRCSSARRSSSSSNVRAWIPRGRNGWPVVFGRRGARPRSTMARSGSPTSNR